MKNVIKNPLKVIAAAAFMVALGYGVSTNSEVSESGKISNVNLSAFSSVSAGGECGQTCVQNDCAWWNPFCSQYSGADPRSHFEQHGLCTFIIRNCYPGTGSCSERTIPLCL